MKNKNIIILYLPDIMYLHKYLHKDTLNQRHKGTSGYPEKERRQSIRRL